MFYFFKVVVSNMFIFTPTWGNDPIQISKCFSNGLVQPPPSLGYHTQQRLFVWCIQFNSSESPVTRKKNPWCFRWGKQVRGGRLDAGKSEAKLTYCGAQGSLTCIRPIEEGEVRGPTGSTLMSNPPSWWGEPH